jgi:hypothetical protein
VIDPKVFVFKCEWEFLKKLVSTCYIVRGVPLDSSYDKRLRDSPFHTKTYVDSTNLIRSNGFLFSFPTRSARRIL